MWYDHNDPKLSQLCMSPGVRTMTALALPPNASWHHHDSSVFFKLLVLVGSKHLQALILVATSPRKMKKKLCWASSRTWPSRPWSRRSCGMAQHCFSWSHCSMEHVQGISVSRTYHISQLISAWVGKVFKTLHPHFRAGSLNMPATVRKLPFACSGRWWHPPANALD